MTGGVFCPSWQAISPNIERNLPMGRNLVHAPDRWGDSALLAPPKSPMFILYQFEFICQNLFPKNKSFNLLLQGSGKLWIKQNATELQNLIQQTSLSPWILWLKLWYRERQQSKRFLWAPDVLKEKGLIWASSAHHCLSVHLLRCYAGVASFSERLPPRPIAITWRF